MEEWMLDEFEEEVEEQENDPVLSMKHYMQKDSSEILNLLPSNARQLLFPNNPTQSFDQLEILKKENEALKKQNMVLIKNMTRLYLTARKDIRQKNMEIQHLKDRVNKGKDQRM